MSFHYGQAYPGGTHPPPGAHGGGGAGPYRPPAASPYGGAGGPPYGGYGAPAQGVPYGQGPGGPSGPYPGGHAPGGPYGGYGAQPQGGAYGAQPQGGAYRAQPQGGAYGAQPQGGAYGAQPQGGAYGHQGPAGNVPPGVSPEAFQWFHSVDADHSGSITRQELRQALVNANWSPFSDETCLMMINMFDRTRTGCIDVFGFSALWGFIQQWRAHFQQYDRDRSGTISGTELHQALAQMGYNLSPQFSETVVGRFTVQGGRPGIQLDRFIQVCIQLQSMTQAFKERDQAMTGNVRLSYEEFLSGAVQRLM